MKSRMEKYYTEQANEIPNKRTSKNSELYKQINESELNEFNIGSNAFVIGENESDININRIKEILEKNYHEVPKRSQIRMKEEPISEVELEKTREYDINTILEKAREEKEVNYEQERLKKIRDTQYDILRNLDLENEEKLKSADIKTKEELMNLINTITENELSKTKSMDPLDILSDLKGTNDNTIIMGAKEFEDATKELTKEEQKKESTKMDDSFYTNSLSFDQSDFDDFNDLKESVQSTKIIIRIIIIIVALAIIAGIVFLLNNLLNLGLF